MWMWLNAFVLVAFAVNCSFAINCYLCDSSVNVKCVNLTDRAIKPEPCTYDKLVSDGSTDRTSWLMAVSELHYFKGISGEEIPMVCQKIVGSDENGKQTTLRRCQLENKTPCDFSHNQVIKSNQKHIDFCGVCNKDGCNAAPPSQRTARAGLVVMLLAAVLGVGIGRA